MKMWKLEQSAVPGAHLGCYEKGVKDVSWKKVNPLSYMGNIQGQEATATEEKEKIFFANFVLFC